MQDLQQIIQKLDLQPHEVTDVWYHDPCTDGTGAGYCAWRYFTTKFPEKEIKYRPMAVGASLPSNVEGKNILICDYSFRKDALTELISKANKVLIIDHHKSAEKDLKDFDAKYKWFDMNHSGAMLTWMYFFPTEAPPLLIKYIEDRDIWTKALPNTDDFSSWFYTMPLEFPAFDVYAKDDDLLLKMIGTYGKAYGELNRYYSKLAVEHCVPKFCLVKDKYYLIGYVNSTVVKSDVGNDILLKYPILDFSAVYSINDGSNNTSFSLRSTDTNADVSEIAFKLGGGGHACASGVRSDAVINYLAGKVLYPDASALYQNIQKIRYGNVIIEGKEYNIVILMSSILQYQLGCYLLQTKYSNLTEVDGEKVKQNTQVCKDISIKTNKQYPSGNVEIALVGEMDPFAHQSSFEVCVDQSVGSVEKQAISTYFQTPPKLVDFFGGKRVVEREGEGECEENMTVTNENGEKTRFGNIFGSSTTYNVRMGKL